MAPKGKGRGKQAAKVTFDYSELKEGTSVQAMADDGVYYPAKVVTVSESKNRTKAPVKVNFNGYAASEDRWVGGDKLRSKALKKETEDTRPPLEFNFGYWKIRGLGSVFRMILEYRGAKYTDNQYSTGDDWFKEDKPKILEKNPLANLPYLECGDDVICQTNAILIYLGQRLRLGGGGNKARVRNEELLCEIYDVRNAVIELVYPFKEVCRTKAEFVAKLTKHVGGKPFAKFEASLEKSGTEYFCGKGPCTSDFHIWEMLDQHRMMAEQNSLGDVFEAIPKCKAFYDRFRALEKLQKYFESESYKFDVNNAAANPYFK